MTDTPRHDGGAAPSPSASSSLVLPTDGTGLRGGERRERRERRRRRRRDLLVRAVVGVAAVALGMAAWQVVPGFFDGGDAVSDVAGGDDGSGQASLVELDAPPRVLLAHQDGDGALVGATVLIVGPENVGGEVLFVPVGSMVEVPSLGLQPLRAAYDDGGLALLQSSMENLLGVPLDAAVPVGPKGTAAMVAPAGSLSVDVPEAVERVDDDGRVQVLFDQGPNDVAPDEVHGLLAQKGSGQDLDRLVRHEAFWRAWLDAVGAAPESATPPESVLEEVADVVVALAAGEVRFDLLPVEAVSSGASTGEGLYRIRTDELDALLARAIPESAAADGERVRVQILNGTGEPGLVQRVQPLLVESGAAVALTGNADAFDYERTQIVYYRDDQLEAARAVQRALGVGEVVKSLSGLVVVDVTVVVGADFDESGDGPPSSGDDGERSGSAFQDRGGLPAAEPQGA